MTLQVVFDGTQRLLNASTFSRDSSQCIVNTSLYIMAECKIWHASNCAQMKGGTLANIF